MKRDAGTWLNIVKKGTKMQVKKHRGITMHEKELSRFATKMKIQALSSRSPEIAA